MARWAVLNHSAKGSEWEDHQYVKRENGKYYYPDNYPGGRHISNAPGNGGGGNKEEKKDFDSSAVAKSAGADEKDIKELYELGASKGFDSKEYLDRLYELSGKDANRAKTITEAIGVGLGHKKTGEKEGSKGFSSEAVAKAAKTDKKNIDELYKIGSTKGFDSKEYLSRLYEISGKDAKRAKEITEAVGVGLGHKKSASDKSTKKTSTKTSAKTASKSSGSKSAKTIAKSTGTDESAVKKAMSVGSKKGYDSKEYLEELRKVSGDDAELAKRVTESIGGIPGHRKKKKAKHSVFLISENYLSHHGIKGQRWGVRRYQNPDGTLTDAGRRRNIDSSNADKQHSGVYSNAASDMKTNKSGLDAASNAASRASNIAKRSEEHRMEKQKQEIDVSEMSDQELREKINRMNMERQYRQLKAEQISAGKIYASDVLATVGDVAAIGASVAGIAAAIYMMKR